MRLPVHGGFFRRHVPVDQLSACCSIRWDKGGWKMAERTVHFIGIGGIGMSGIARLLLERGVPVSGSDAKESANTRELRERGAHIFIGHNPENLQAVREVVISTAIRPGNPELLEAQRLGLTVFHRSLKLAQLVNAHRGITVAGTHGKTTTSSMVTTLLATSGLEPSYVVGGIINTLSDNARSGKTDWFVIEADESDGSLVEYHPEIAVLTNVELDHMDFYRDASHLDDVFLTYLSHVKPNGVCIYCHDDPGARRLVEASHPDLKHCVSYGLTAGAQVIATSIRFDGLGTSFDVYHQGELLGRMALQVPGRHNIQNSLAAVAVGLHVGLSFEQIAAGLHEFRGVERRFQIVGRTGNVTVIDDYAHHPSEIRATLAAARTGTPEGCRIISIFQPHRYSRTKLLAAEFGTAFACADEVVITNIYAAGEDPIPDVSSELIVRSLRESHGRVHHVEGLAEVEEYVAQLMRPDDMIITLGAGDIWKVAHNLSQRLCV